MALAAHPSRRPLALALAAALAAGCSSGSGHTPPPPPPDDCTLTPAMPAGAPFTVSGVATYDFVKATYNPATYRGGLTLATPVPTPIRGADVQVRQCGNVLAGATTTTDPMTGAYSVTFTPGAQGQVSVYVLARTANPPITVQDNTDGNAVWAVGVPITSPSTPTTLNVRATLGWSGSGYDSTRIAAPFAILDDLYTASRRLLDDGARNVPFDQHPLRVNWSPLNQPATDQNGNTVLSAGLIDTSHYDPSTKEIAILGAYGVDTDEFDREVIVHEWGHYFEANFSRSDSPGGGHRLGDVLDPRLAFSEGWASAFAAILLQDRIYADSWWNGGLTAFGWDAETVPAATDDPSPGPFSEMSVIRAVWDLYDPVPPGVTEAWDASAVPLGAIYDALVGPERTTTAQTTLASFVWGLKAQPGVDAPAVDVVLAHYGIGSITSDFGDGDTSLRGIYTNIAAPTATPYTLSLTLNGSFEWNERPQNQYFVFTAAGTQAAFVASSSYDVDLYAVHTGTVLAFDERSYTASPTANVTFATTPGEVYVIVMTGYGGLSYGQGSIGPYGVTLAVSN